MTATELVNAYYAAFNAGDMPAFLALLSEDVIHDINQGERQMGKARFAAFMDKMNRCYRERPAPATDPRASGTKPPSTTSATSTARWRPAREITPGRGRSCR